MAEAYESTFRKDLDESMGKAMVRYNKYPDQLELVFPDMTIKVTKKNLVITVANKGDMRFGTTLNVTAGSNITLTAPEIILNGHVTINGDCDINGSIWHAGHR